MSIGGTLEKNRILLTIFAAILILTLTFSTASFAGINEWTTTGPAGVAAQSVAVSPNFASDNTVFAGTDNGVYKSTDGGSSWTQVNNGLTTTDVRSMAISPNFASDNTLFAGTWGGGLFKSTDGGGNWSSVNNGITSNNIYTVAFSTNYAVDDTVFAGAHGGADPGGVYKSTDSGANWAEANNGIPNNSNVQAIAFSPNYANDSQVYVGIYSRGIYKSTNGGASWVKADSIGNTNAQSIVMSPDYAVDNTVYAATRSGGVFKSTDGGATWTQINNGITNTNALSIDISPNYPVDDTLIVGTWGGGIFKTTDGGAGWEPINAGLSTVNIYSVAVSPDYVNDGTFFAGTKASVFQYTVDETPPQTTLLTDPISPDGDNDWFITAPTVTLSRNEPGTTYYQWDSTSTTGWSTYLTSFGALEGVHTLYYYSEDNGGNIETLNSQVFKIDTTAPSASILSGAAASATQINLSWTNAIDNTSGVGGYRIYNANNNQLLATTALTTKTFSSLTPGTTYKYYVKAVDAAGNVSGASNTVSITTPAAPGDTTPPATPLLVGFAPSNSQATIYWRAVVDNVGVVGYKIYNGDTNALLANTSTTSYTFSGLTPGISYRYYIKAYDAAGNHSSASNTVGVDPGRNGITEANQGDPEAITPGPDVSVTFTNTLVSGTTSVTRKPRPSSGLPAGFAYQGNIYDIEVTASYVPPIKVAIKYNPADLPGREESLQMFHWDGSQWENVTLFVDAPNDVIVGQVNSLSPILLGSPITGEDKTVTYLFALGMIAVGGALVYRRSKSAEYLIKNRRLDAKPNRYQ